jgi:hypothetical protein
LNARLPHRPGPPNALGPSAWGDRPPDGVPSAATCSPGVRPVAESTRKGDPVPRVRLADPPANVRPSPWNRSAINRPLLRLISTLQAYATQPVPRPDPLEPPPPPPPRVSHTVPRGGGTVGPAFKRDGRPSLSPRTRTFLPPLGGEGCLHSPVASRASAPVVFPHPRVAKPPPHPYNGPPWGPSVPMFADRYLNPEVRAALYHSLPTGHWGAGTLSRWPDPSDTVVIRNPEGHWPFPPSKTFLWAHGAHRIPSNPVAFFTETPFI